MQEVTAEKYYIDFILTCARKYDILITTYREKEYRYSVILFEQLAYFIPLCTTEDAGIYKEL